MTWWCLRGLPRQSRPSGPDTVSRTAGGQSCIRTSRLEVGSTIETLFVLQVHPKGRVIYKGINPSVDSYSAFFDNAKMGKTTLADQILEEGCTDVYVCGIATDVCVGKLLHLIPGKLSIYQHPPPSTPMSWDSGQS